MSKTIKISEQTYTIPEIDELTIKHLIDLRQVDPAKPLQILTWGVGKEPQLIDRPQTDREVGNALTLIEGLIVEVMAWMQSDERVRVPKEIDVLGFTVKCDPGLLQQLPYWGTVHCKTVIQSSPRNAAGEVDYTDAIPEIIAHYLYSLVTRNKYDEDAAEDFIDVVNSLNMKTCVQLGNFFLLKQKSLYQNKTSYWLTRLTIMSKRLVLRFSKSMGILTI